MGVEGIEAEESIEKIGVGVCHDGKLEERGRDCG